MSWREMTKEELEREPFLLREVVDGSVYYPACEFDGSPVRVLAKSIDRFVYVDYGVREEELRAQLVDSRRGFAGYHVIHYRPVTESELTPNGYTLPPPAPGEMQPNQSHQWMQAHGVEPFASWTVLERKASRGTDYGPRRLSLLYICGDGVATYHALYSCNGLSAAAIAIIQPGTGFGGNWTDFRDRQHALGWTIMDLAKKDRPSLLLQGEWGAPRQPPQPFWPEFSLFVSDLPPEGMQGYLELWKTRVVPPLFQKAIGIDLAGFRGKDTACVKTEWRNGDIVATLLPPNTLCQDHPGIDSAVPILLQDAQKLRQWIVDGYGVSMDCPIDLQGLPTLLNPQYLWQLIRRAIDRLVNGIPPLADKLGSVVARCLATLQHENLRGELGIHLFETYPKAILIRKRFERSDIKKGWIVLLAADGPQEVEASGDTEQEREQNGLAVVAELRRLHVVCGGEQPVRLTDHQLDAILCTSPLLSDNPTMADTLTEELHNEYPDLKAVAPQGYILDDKNIWWDRIIVNGPVIQGIADGGVGDAGNVPPPGPNMPGVQATLHICDAGGVHMAHNEWLVAYVGVGQVVLITRDRLVQQITLTPAAEAPGYWCANPTTTSLFRTRGGVGHLSGDNNKVIPVTIRPRVQ